MTRGFLVASECMFKLLESSGLTPWSSASWESGIIDNESYILSCMYSPQFSEGSFTESLAVFFIDCFGTFPRFPKEVIWGYL